LASALALHNWFLHANYGLVPSIAQTMVFAIWFAWFYFNTVGSFLATAFFHSFNALTLFAIFPVAFIYSPSSVPVVYLYVSTAIITAAMLVYSGTKTMVRQAK
jgi:hypothetical protein